MTLGSAAHKIPLEVAHTLVEIAEVARYAYHHRPGRPATHEGDPTAPPAGADSSGGTNEDAARLLEENAMLRARLADDLALLRELHGAPCVSKECPPDVSILPTSDICWHDYQNFFRNAPFGSLGLNFIIIVVI